MTQNSNDEINFFYEEIDFKLSDENKYIFWIIELLKTQNAALSGINYIFCSDDFLLKINKEYLDHDFYTDIISFPYSEFPDPLQGDIFISIDRVMDNAISNGVPSENELLRVMAHGILHFLGYKDKSEKDQHLMRAKEEEMMYLFTNIA